MFNIFVYVRYSNASLVLDWYIFLGALIFFVLCGILIFQNKIWEEEAIQEIKNGINGKHRLLRQI